MEFKSIRSVYACSLLCSVGQVRRETGLAGVGPDLAGGVHALGYFSWGSLLRGSEDLEEVRR